MKENTTYYRQLAVMYRGEGQYQAAEAIEAMANEVDALAAELARVRGEAAQREAAENRMFDGLEQMLNQDDVDNDAYNDYVYNAIGRRD